MSYVDHMSSEQLAINYKKFSDELALQELRKRDRLSKMTYDEQMALRFEEPDNQMLFEFAQVERDNPSVKDEWAEAYEAGFSAGKSAGIRVSELKLELECRDEIILGHGKDDTGSGNSEAESHRD